VRIRNKLLRREKKTGSSLLPKREESGADSLQCAGPLDIGQATDKGGTREINEDAFFTFQAVNGTSDAPSPLALLMVADGLGGHAGGREASTTAVRVAARALLTELLLPILMNEPREAGRRPVQEILSEAIISANQSVSQIKSDAGTTLTVALVADHSAYAAHVGDTRLYYIAAGKATQITEDHSLVSRLVELGEISPQEAKNHPQRNFLYRALGQDPELAVDAHLQRLAPGSYLLLCSDGLWGLVSDEEMVEVIDEAPSLQQACNRLIELANERGGDDNATVILARINY
jgi:serine/threonine protein phosphatase PrpC